jgi:hypothetical protein
MYKNIDRNPRTFAYTMGPVQAVTGVRFATAHKRQVS